MFTVLICWIYYVCKHQYFISLTLFYKVNIKSFEISSLIFSFSFSSFIYVRSKSFHLSLTELSTSVFCVHSNFSVNVCWRYRPYLCNAQYGTMNTIKCYYTENSCEWYEKEEKGMLENNQMQRSPISNILRKILAWRQRV